MDKKIYSLSSYAMGCSGYATIAGRGNGARISFSLKNLPKGEFLCLYCEDSVVLCGTVSQGHPFTAREIAVRSAKPSFGVFDQDGTCLMYNGTSEALDQMSLFLAPKESPSPLPISEEENATVLREPAPPRAQSKAPQESATSYWEKNSEHFHALLNSNPHISCLEEIMPGSAWAHISQEDYLFGIIRDEAGRPLYICYGVEGSATQQAPPELEDYCHWLPENLLSDTGWWVLYQNAADGEALKA